MIKEYTTNQLQLLYNFALTQDKNIQDILISYINKLKDKVNWNMLIVEEIISQISDNNKQQLIKLTLVNLLGIKPSAPKITNNITIDLFTFNIIYS